MLKNFKKGVVLKKKLVFCLFLIVSLVLTSMPFSASTAFAGNDSSPSGLISDLKVYDSNSVNAANWSVSYNLQNGDLQFGDRNYLFTDIPSDLWGCDWIRTANSSKAYTSNPMATFKVNEYADVYVALCADVQSVPSWLSDWTYTGSDIISNNMGNPTTFRLYKKTYVPGSTVILGPNGSTVASLYSVVVKQIPPPPPVPTIGYWKFDEGSGSIAYDSSGNGHDGTLMNNPTWRTDGKVGGCLEFNGVNQYVDVGNPPDFQFTGAFSVSAWVYINSAGGGGTIIGKRGGSGKRSWVLSVEMDGTGRFGVSIDGGASSYDIYSPVLPLGKWINLAGVYEPGVGMHIYLDGLLYATNSNAPAQHYDNGKPVSIGKRYDGVFFNGRIDELRLYNVPLNSMQVAELAQVELIPLTIAPPMLTETKAYDGTTTAAVTPGNLSGVYEGDDVKVNATAVYSDKNVGDNKIITVVYTLTGIDAKKYIKPDNDMVYTGEIVAKELTVSGAKARYTPAEAAGDGEIGVTGGTLVGVVTGDDVTLDANGTGTISGTSAQEPVVVSGYSISGTGAGNYALTQPDYLTVNALLTTASPLLVVTDTLTLSKVYDRTTTAEIQTEITGGLNGVNEDVTVRATAAYDDWNVGTGKTIAVVYTFEGDDADLYVLPDEYTVSSGEITAKPLTVSGAKASYLPAAAAGDGKIGVTGGTLVGVETGDSVTLYARGKGMIAGATADEEVTVTGYTISGPDAGNYGLVQPTGLTVDATATTRPMTTNNITVDSSRRYFVDATGKPMFLLGHYNWASIDPNCCIDSSPTKAETMIDDAYLYHYNFIRMSLGLNRETADTWPPSWDGSTNPTPFKYVDVGGGVFKADLNQWDDRFWDGVEHFAAYARERNVILLYSIFDGVELRAGSESYRYSNSYWNTNNQAGYYYDEVGNYNNADTSNGFYRTDDFINGTGIGKYQKMMIDKLIETVNGYDNVSFEVGNELLGASSGWYQAVIDYIKTKTNKLVMVNGGGTPTNMDGLSEHGLDGWARGVRSTVSNLIGKGYPAYVDPDGVDQLKSGHPDRVRQAVWTAFASGSAAYGGFTTDYQVDDPILGNKGNVLNLTYKQYFMDFLSETEIPFWDMLPNHSLVSNSSVNMCLAEIGGHYLAYVPRVEISLPVRDTSVPFPFEYAKPGEWGTSDASVTVTLAAGSYLYQTYDTKTGVLSAPQPVSGGAARTFTRPEGADDWAVYIYSVDKTAPTTTDNAPSGWVNQDTTVNLSASDSGSGVTTTLYTVDGGTQQTGTSVTLAAEGVHTLIYWSVDNAGNIEAQHTATVKIDKTAPVSGASVSPVAPNGSNGWYTSDVTVSLSAIDNLSGVAKTEYQVNNGVWITYTGSIPAFGEGIYKVGYRSTDQAGNVEPIKTIEFKIDKTAPLLTVQLDKTVIWPPNHKMVTIHATLNSSDATSGVASVVLTSITSNEPDSGQGDIQANFGTKATSFSLRAERSGQGSGRIYTITYTAIDKAGNKTVISVTVTVPLDDILDSLLQDQPGNQDQKEK